MPNYVIYNPDSTPIAGLVTDYRRSYPKEDEPNLGPNILINPDITGITLQEAKVVGGVLSNLTQGEKDTIVSTQAAAYAVAVKAAAKDIFVNPSDPTAHAINLGFQTVLEMIVSELNILRAIASPVQAARTNNQVKASFKSTYETKVDNL